MILWYRKGMRVEVQISKYSSQTFEGRVTADHGCGKSYQIWIDSPKIGEVCIEKNFIRRIRIGN